MFKNEIVSITWYVTYEFKIVECRVDEWNTNVMIMFKIQKKEKQNFLYSYKNEQGIV